MERKGFMLPSVPATCAARQLAFCHPCPVADGRIVAEREGYTTSSGAGLEADIARALQ